MPLLAADVDVRHFDRKHTVPAAAAAAGADAVETDPFELLTTERFKYVAPEWR